MHDRHARGHGTARPRLASQPCNLGSPQPPSPSTSTSCQKSSWLLWRREIKQDGAVNNPRRGRKSARLQPMAAAAEQQHHDKDNLDLANDATARLVQLVAAVPWACLGPGNLATGLASHHLNPLPLVRLSLDPTLQSPARSRPHFAHTRPLSASNERELQVATRLDSTERCAARSCDPIRFPAFFLTCPAPSSSSGLQLSPKACLQVRKTGTALPDASLDSAAAHPPDAQSRHKFIRCHRSDYRKYGGDSQVRSSGCLCLCLCLCSRVEVEAVPVVTENGEVL
ncbi:hypothetical protein J3F84DRAFT_176567 [Trichoderma pleuroticola]